jgi:mono/diheme cytochrome c family protein
MQPLSFAPVLILVVLAIGTGADAKPRTYVLPDETAALRPASGPGFAAAQNNCAACHSADYVDTQPLKLGAAFWTAEVRKMIHVYHAPIDDADAKIIAEYLGAAY